MKKALVLALTVLMVLSLATAAFAVEVTYEGKVGVKWTSEDTDKAADKVKNIDKFDKDALEAKITVDFTEDYGDGVTAGVKVKTEVQNNEVWDDVNEDDKWDPLTEKPTREVVFDGSGWIKVERDLFTVQASTGIDGQVGRDLKENAITKAAGLGLDLNLIDGFTVNTILNAGSEYNYLVKGEFAQDLFTIGGGYQNSVNDKDVNSSALGFYGSLNLIEDLAINAEFGRRDLNVDTDKNEYTAIFATAAYDLDALSTKAGFLTQDILFGKSISADDVDNEDWRINEEVRAKGTVSEKKYNPTVLFADASYQLTDALAVNGYVDYLLGVTKNDGDKKVDLTKDEEKAVDKVSYKAGVAYTIDALKLEGWYKAYIGNEVAAKATYTLAEGVDASFTLANGKDDKDNKDEKAATSYKAVITAKF